LQATKKTKKWQKQQQDLIFLPKQNIFQHLMGSFLTCVLNFDVNLKFCADKIISLKIILFIRALKSPKEISMTAQF